MTGLIHHARCPDNRLCERLRTTFVCQNCAGTYPGCMSCLDDFHPIEHASMCDECSRKMQSQENSKYLARCLAVLYFLGDKRPIPRYIYQPWHSEVPVRMVMP